MEGMPVAAVLSQLEDAKNCIQFLLPGARQLVFRCGSSDDILESSPWQSALLDRISLRIVRPQSANNSVLPR
jgi:hypothetical protein